MASNKVHQAKGNDSAYVRNSEGLIMPTGSYKSIDDGLYYVGHRTMDLESVEKMQPIWAMRWARCKETFIHDTCVQLGIPYEPL